MVHKTIMVQEEIYDILTALKGEDKSYNDVIRELIQKSGELKPFFGIIDDDKAEIMLKAINQLKEQVLPPSKQDKLTRAWE